LKGKNSGIKKRNLHGKKGARVRKWKGNTFPRLSHYKRSKKKPYSNRGGEKKSSRKDGGPFRDSAGRGKEISRKKTIKEKR